jgi:peptide-methionine (R)-S-oxide reductase
MDDMKKMDENYWKEKLTPEQYKVLRERGTEAPFSGEYHDKHEDGMYKCAACGQQLFSSDKKFESMSGWPSFDDAIPGSVEFREDKTYMMNRTEVICSKCGSHLGHIFDDGPKDTTGKRFCINSTCLVFSDKEEK